MYNNIFNCSYKLKKVQLFCKLVNFFIINNIIFNITNILGRYNINTRNINL